MVCARTILNSKKARSLLRPADLALNEHNRKVVPSGLWVLKGVKASATPGGAL